MNLEQAGYFIRHPYELTAAHAEPLQKLAEKNPYSAIYYMLYLTALSNGKSTDLDEALRNHAYRLSDRTQLYRLLTSKENSPAGINEIIAGQDSPEEASDHQSSREATGTIIETTLPEDVAEEPGIQPEVQPERKTEAEIAEDFDRITEAFTHEQHVEIINDQPQLPDLPVINEEKEEIKEAGNPVAEPSQKRSFTSWLHSGEEVNKAGKSQETPAEEPKKPSVNALIDKFIEEEPRITRSKTEFFSPTKKAKESLSEEAVPVSETLAKIYAAQGNYPKAIHVYHQLMLSIPEKKSFFAIQIEELKQKITS